MSKRQRRVPATLVRQIHVCASVRIMSDLQPGSRDIIIRQIHGGYVVETLSTTQSRILCATYPAALGIASGRARNGGVDVWFVETDTPWRVIGQPDVFD